MFPLPCFVPFSRLGISALNMSALKLNGNNCRDECFDVHPTTFTAIEVTWKLMERRPSSSSNVRCLSALWDLIVGLVLIVPQSRCSAVGIATGYGLDDGGTRVWVPVRSRIFTSPYRPYRLPGPTQSPVPWVPGALAQGVKWQWPESDHTLQRLAQENLDLYIFMAYA
jgi:hypothetical protein